MKYRLRVWFPPQLDTTRPNTAEDFYRQLSDVVTTSSLDPNVHSSSDRSHSFLLVIDFLKVTFRPVLLVTSSRQVLTPADMSRVLGTTPVHGSQAGNSPGSKPVNRCDFPEASMFKAKH